VVLVGGGIMSTTLAMLLHTLEPTLKIAIFERLGRFAKESSSAWNNAGTGHSAFCELNYTPMDSQGRISITKAEAIATQFELSRQFWAYMVERGFVSDPEDFITPCPHQSLVFGPEDREFLRKRFEAMLESPLFKGMEYSENFDKLREWMPLIMEGRSPKEVLAATRMEIGTDVKIDTVYDYHTKERDLPQGRFGSYTDQLKKLYASQNAQQHFEHAARQSYIALGLAMAQAAELKVDSTPAEGFSPEKVDDILGLRALGLKSVTLLYLGYRDEKNDWLSSMKKVRIPMEELIIKK